MGTKLQPGRFDCYKAAEPAEPLFTLLARDPLAPALVMEWADQYAELKGLSSQDPKVCEARRCGMNMLAWQRRRLGVPYNAELPEMIRIYVANFHPTPHLARRFFPEFNHATVEACLKQMVMKGELQIFTDGKLYTEGTQNVQNGEGKILAYPRTLDYDDMARELGHDYVQQPFEGDYT